MGERRLERRAAVGTARRGSFGDETFAGHRVDDRSQPGEVDAEATQHLAGRPLDVEQAEQDVLAVDLLVVLAQREPRRPLEDPPGPVGQLQLAGAHPTLLDGHGVRHLLSSALQGRPRRHQRPGADALPGEEHPEQHVLGPDVPVAQSPRLFLGQPDDPPGPAAEPIEHPRNRTTRLATAAGIRA